jgi:hypothetical protein
MVIIIIRQFSPFVNALQPTISSQIQDVAELRREQAQAETNSIHKLNELGG